jgi:hypothetical protein
LASALANVSGTDADPLAKPKRPKLATVDRAKNRVVTQSGIGW